MPGRTPEYQPTFSAWEVRKAEAILRKRSAPQNQVCRARLALALAEDATANCWELGRRLGLHRQTVRKWRKRWALEGFSLEDRPRPGRPRSFSPSRRCAGEGDRV
jgi:hypothetical protein